MEYITAGESHGPKLTAIVTGVPAGLRLNEKSIASDMRRRQSGYGRGGRMKIERDTAVITSGVRFGKTLGTPIAVDIVNSDWVNWEDKMAAFGVRPDDCTREVTPRPGHADLVGFMKTNTDDCRDILERASARETAARVAAGAIARELLASVGVEVFSWVNSIADVSYNDTEEIDFCSNEIPDDLLAKIEFSQTRCPSESVTEKMIERIEEAKHAGETCGGTFRVMATGVVPGLGSYAEAKERLSSKLAQAMFSIPAIKGFEIGAGFAGVQKLGTQFHDEIALKHGAFTRKSNNAGGLEGGMTNGMPLVLTAAMKPIPTCMNPLETVNLDTLEVAKSSKERSDVCAVPAAAVVAEAEVSIVLADAYVKMFGNTNMADLKANLKTYTDRLAIISR